MHRTRQVNPQRGRGCSDANCLEDKVYRAMLRLEADKPEAASELCRCLHHAWLDSTVLGGTRPIELWLIQITPICLEMLTCERPD